MCFVHCLLAMTGHFLDADAVLWWVVGDNEAQTACGCNNVCSTLLITHMGV
jgi:hypothetical protein